MIVVADASVLVPALADSGLDGDRVRQWLIALSDDQEVHILQTFTHLEFISAVRSLVRKGVLDADRAEDSTKRLLAFPARFHRLTQPMIARIWEMRDNVTPYDAAYVALVERLQSESSTSALLATADSKLASAPSLSIDVRLFRS
jgi:predicted nucleic acid-binding protein